MKKIFAVVLGLFSFLAVFSQLQVGAGTYFRSTAGTFLVLDALGLQYDGVNTTIEPVVKFSGTGNAPVSGLAQPRFTVLQVDKISGGQVRLQRNIDVNQSVFFVNGYLDLNGYETSLATLATISGEREGAGFTGSGGGFVSITANLVFPTSANPGNLGVIINAPANMGNTIIRRGHRSQTNGGGGGNSILRYYDILPANNTGLNATLRFFYRDEELNGLPENNLQFWKSTDNINWLLQGFSSRDMSSNYMSLTGINSFSRWTLSTPGNALPVSWGAIRLDCSSGQPLLYWETLHEQNSMQFRIERSRDAVSWEEAGLLAAAGNSQDKRTYQFTDLSGQTTGFYRIVQVDADGRRNISAVIRNTCQKSFPLQVWPNPVKSTLKVSLLSTVSGKALLRLLDNRGRIVLVSEQSVVAGTNQLVLDMERLSPAMYQLQVLRPGEEKATVVPVIKN